MKISASPCSRCRSRSRLRYCAWIVRSRLVVGSSAISRRGSQEMPMAPTMRWRMPPDISCGYCVTRVSGEGMRTDFSRSFARCQATERPASLMHADRFGDLIADGEQRIQRCHRILQDHGDPLAAHVPHLAVGLAYQVLALEHHRAADDLRRGGQHAQDGQRQRALAGAGFADDAERLAGVDAQRHVIDRAYHAGSLLRDVVRREVVDLEQRAVRQRGHRPARLRADGAVDRV